jgi:hypothetical protein
MSSRTQNQPPSPKPDPPDDEELETELPDELDWLLLELEELDEELLGLLELVALPVLHTSVPVTVDEHPSVLASAQVAVTVTVWSHCQL